LAPIFNAEMKDLVAAGAKYLQFEDLGAWLPLFTNDVNDYKWIREVVEQCCDGVDAKIGWHFCFGNAWGNDILSATYPDGYQTVLPYFFETKGIDQFVLDYANRDMRGVEFLKNLPKDKDEQRKSVALEYLKAFDNKGVTSSGGSILDLFADDAQVFFPKWGLATGKKQIGQLFTDFGGLIEQILHDYAMFNWVMTGTDTFA